MCGDKALSCRYAAAQSHVQRIIVSAGRFFPMRRIPHAALLIFFLCLGASDFTADFDNQIQTEHFLFHFNGTANGTIQEIARFSEGFLAVLKKEFFNPEFDSPIQVLVLPTREAFQNYVKKRFNMGPPPNFGLYLSDYRTFATFEGAGLGTFAHEIMHPLVARNLPRRPEWADEGIPSFFEKFFGYWEAEELVLRFGYQNPWRIRALGEGLDRLDLKKILLRPRNDYRINKNSDLRMVSVFLFRQGKLQRYLDLVRRDDRRGYGTYFEAAFDQELPEIEPLWRAYLRDTKDNRSRIDRIPASKIFNRKKEYDTFMKDNKLEKMF